MGRTLVYSLIENPSVPVTRRHWARIRRLTARFNRDFPWTCEKLGFLTSGQSAIGGTKVAGNEYNAFLVAAWLVKVSRILPRHEFKLHDQGRFLKIDLIVKNGLAGPDLESARRSLISVRRKIKQGVPDKTAYEKEQELLCVALEEFKDGRFTEISRYCRPVDPRDFEKHARYGTVNIDLKHGFTSGDLGQCMSGYEGEYWGMISPTEARWKSKEVSRRVLELLKRA
jgi:hypothetical protein